jgi:predicted nucleotidyltransferase
MPGPAILKGTPLTNEEREFLRILLESGARFMIVGMAAADLQGANIGTQDIDLWFESTSDGNLDRAARAVGGMFMWRANPPSLMGDELERIDIVQTCSGLRAFGSEYGKAIEVDVEGLPLKVLPLSRVIVSKEAADRPKDRVYIPTLKAVLEANIRFRQGGKRW